MKSGQGIDFLRMGWSLDCSHERCGDRRYTVILVVGAYIAAAAPVSYH